MSRIRNTGLEFETHLFTSFFANLLTVLKVVLAACGLAHGSAHCEKIKIKKGSLKKISHNLITEVHTIQGKKAVHNCSARDWVG
jgi:hypothetical protein